MGKKSQGISQSSLDPVLERKILKPTREKKKDILHTMKQKLTMTGMKGNLQDRKQWNIF